MKDTRDVSKIGVTEYVVTSYNIDGDDFDPDAIRWCKAFPTRKAAEASVAKAGSYGDILAKMERRSWREVIFNDGEFGRVRDATVVYDDGFYMEWDWSSGWRDETS